MRTLSSSEFIYSGAREVTTEWVHRPIGPIGRFPGIRIFFINMVSFMGHFVVCLSGQTLHLIVFKRSEYSPFSHCVVTLVHVYPLGKQVPLGNETQWGNKVRVIYCIYFWWHCRVLPERYLVFPSIGNGSLIDLTQDLKTGQEMPTAKVGISMLITSSWSFFVVNAINALMVCPSWIIPRRTQTYYTWPQIYLGQGPEFIMLALLPITVVIPLCF